MPYNLEEVHDYYLTPQAQHPRAANKVLMLSILRVLTFNAFHLADLYLTQQLLLIIRKKAGSSWHTEKLDRVIPRGATKKIVVPGGTHIDF